MANKRKRLERRLDALCKDITRLEASNICLKCRQWCKSGDPHHVVLKGNGSSWRRFDLKNIVWVCRRCHTWWHSNWGLAERFFKYIWPHINTYLDKYRGGKPVPISDAEMEELIVEYKEKITQLQ